MNVNESEPVMSEDDEIALIREVGLLVRDTRKERCFMQSYLADEAGISRTFLSGVERGSQLPSIYTLACLAKALRKKLQIRFVEVE